MYHRQNLCRCGIFPRYLFIICMLFNLLVPKAELLSMGAVSSEKDTIEQFFDHVEILKRAYKNQIAIDQLTAFIEKDEYRDNQLHLMRTYNELAENYRWIGDTSNALYFLDKVENEYHAHPSLEKREYVRFNFYKGKIFRSKQLYDSAEYYHKKALNISDQFNYNTSSMVAEIWMDLGLIYKRYLGDIQTALSFYIKAQNIIHDNVDQWHVKRAALYYSLASTYRELGDFERAITYARMAELIFSHHGNIIYNQVINCKVVQANCFFYDRKYKEANNIYENVINIFINQVKPTIGALERTLFNNGIALYEIKEYEKAKYYAEQSIKVNLLENYADSIDLAYSYFNLSLILGQLNLQIKSEELLQNALSIFLNKFGDKHIEVCNSYLYLAKYYENQNQLDKALDFYQKSLIAGFVDFDETNIYINPSSFDAIPKNTAFNILFDKARTFKKKHARDQKNKDLLAAFDLYKIAYELIREAANSDFMEESLLNIPETYKDDLNYGVECALALYENTKDQKYLDHLLQFVETNKYFLLQNSAAKSKSKETLGIPDSAYQKEKDLLEQINTLKQEINNTSFENDQEEYDKRLSLLNATIEWETVRKLWNASDDAKFAFTDLSSTISLDSIRSQIIEKNDILLEYFQTLDTLYTIVIDKNNERILKTPKTKELEIQMGIYLDQMFNKDNSNSKDDFIKFVNASYFLYEKLVYPVLSINSSSPETENPGRLIIIPDGQLSIMPFESLIQEIADTTIVSYWGLNYLCRDYIINYAYSVNLLNDNLVTENEDHNNEILAFSYSSLDNKDMVAARGDEYGELPYSEVELQNIRKWIRNGKFFYGGLAAESAFKSNAQDHDIIHLALHGYGDTVDILNSYIVFKSSVNDIEDGRLYAHELYGIDLSRTKLAVLSACETGIGKTMQGEGVYSLARGFAYAGCPSIVMSLWKVNDETTAKLMDYFYENLAKGLYKDKALQQAKLTFIENSDDLVSHPSNWAAFIILGNNQPLQFSKSIFQWYHWVVMAMVVIGSALYYKRRKLAK